jgi:hypothetical protein
MTLLAVILLPLAVLLFIVKAKAEHRMTYVDTNRAIRAVEEGTADRMLVNKRA